MNNELKLKVTWGCCDEVLSINTYTDFNGIENKAQTELINLKDKITREALIKLGWTPPKEESKSSAIDTEEAKKLADEAVHCLINQDPRCPQCDGTGEGCADGVRCSKCRGRGY